MALMVMTVMMRRMELMVMMPHVAVVIMNAVT
jgi:hypothetical protein